MSSEFDNSDDQALSEDSEDSQNSDSNTEDSEKDDNRATLLEKMAADDAVIIMDEVRFPQEFLLRLCEIMRNNRELNELNIEDCSLTSDTARQLISAFPPSLTSLRLCDDDVEDGAYTIFGIHFPAHLIKLSLSGKKIRGEEIIALFQLRPANLIELSIDKSSGKDVVAGLAEILPHTNLESLRFDSSDLDDGDIRQLATSLPHSLEELILQNNLIGPAGAQMLANVLNDSIITHLDLNSNDAKDAGALALITSFPPNLTTLDLSCNGIGDISAQALAKLSPLRLSQLFLQDNSIGDVGAQALAESQLAFHLSEMSLAGNPIGHVGVNALAAFIMKSTRLELFYLYPCVEFGQRKLAKAILLSRAPLHHFNFGILYHGRLLANLLAECVIADACAVRCRLSKDPLLLDNSTAQLLPVIDTFFEYEELVRRVFNANSKIVIDEIVKVVCLYLWAVDDIL